MTRSFVLILSVVVSVWVADSLDTVIAVAGAVLGMTNVLLFPALCHLKLIAKTKSERIADYLIIAFSIFMVFFGPATILMEWNTNNFTKTKYIKSCLCLCLFRQDQLRSDELIGLKSIHYRESGGRERAFLSWAPQISKCFFKSIDIYQVWHYIFTWNI